MIYHAVPLAEWDAEPGQPYVTPSLEDEGFIHCSPDEATTLAVVNAFYREAPRPLVALLIDEARVTARVEAEAAVPAPPPGVPADTLFPHLFGPLNRDAVVQVLDVVWDGEDRASGLRPR
ncbi:DUF952 domain-containing protein [Streptomyces sp. NPDC089919]|uniref:DUF952 domain-containing protein n=1 Tax=Streptomyces sp. NPDC089919 TaxID=3155188 RepID=UPI00341F15EC